MSKAKEIDPSFQAITVRHDTCDLLIKGVQVSFFYYPYSQMDEFVIDKEFPGLKLASIIDIACMKSIAISERGTKKDFFDLYWIIHDEKLSAKSLVKTMMTKYGKARNYPFVAMSLQYFIDADEEKLPNFYKPCDWETIKNFFIIFSKDFSQTLLSNND